MASLLETRLATPTGFLYQHSQGVDMKWTLFLEEGQVSYLCLPGHSLDCHSQQPQNGPTRRNSGKQVVSVLMTFSV